MSAIPPIMQTVDVTDLAMPEVTAADGWCLIGPWKNPDRFGFLAGYSFEGLRFRGDGLDALAGGQPPTRVELEIDDIRTRLPTDDPVIEYLTDVTSARFGIDLAFAAQYDALGRLLSIEKLELDFPGDNAVQIAGEVAGLDLTSQGALEMSLGQAGLTRLNLTVRSHGLFESYVVLPLGLPLLDNAGPDAPEQVVATAIGQARQIVQRLPDGLMDGASRDALDRLLSEMPNPWGTLTIDFNASTGFGAQRFANFSMTGIPNSLDGWLPAFDGVTIAVDYEPSQLED